MLASTAASRAAGLNVELFGASLQEQTEETECFQNEFHLCYLRDLLLKSPLHFFTAIHFGNRKLLQEQTEGTELFLKYTSPLPPVKIPSLRYLRLLLLN